MCVCLCVCGCVCVCVCVCVFVCLTSLYRSMCPKSDIEVQILNQGVEHFQDVLKRNIMKKENQRRRKKKNLSVFLLFLCVWVRDFLGSWEWVCLLWWLSLCVYVCEILCLSDCVSVLSVSVLWVKQWNSRRYYNMTCQDVKLSDVKLNVDVETKRKM